jgi:hypothetical protein
MATPDLMARLAEIERDAKRGLEVIQLGRKVGQPTTGATALKRIAQAAHDAQTDPEEAKT